MLVNCCGTRAIWDVLFFRNNQHWGRNGPPHHTTRSLIDYFPPTTCPEVCYSFCDWLVCFIMGSYSAVFLLLQICTVHLCCFFSSSSSHPRAFFFFIVADDTILFQITVFFYYSSMSDLACCYCLSRAGGFTWSFIYLFIYLKPLFSGWECQPFLAYVLVHDPACVSIHTCVISVSVDFWELVSQLLYELTYSTVGELLILFNLITTVFWGKKK